MSILCLRTSDSATLPEVCFPTGRSQTFARWIIKPQYHILCWLPPPPVLWLTHLKCTGRAATPVTYLHFKCPRLKRIWKARSFQHIPSLPHPVHLGKLVRNHTDWNTEDCLQTLNSSLDPCGILTELSFYHDIGYFCSFLPEQILKISDCPIQRACSQTFRDVSL